MSEGPTKLPLLDPPPKEVSRVEEARVVVGPFPSLVLVKLGKEEDVAELLAVPDAVLLAALAAAPKMACCPSPEP